RRRDRQSGRLDALQLRDPRRARAVRRADRRSAPVEHRRERGLAAHLRDLGPRGAQDHRKGRRRLQGGDRMAVAERVSERVERLRATLEEPLLVTSGVNVRYLTGFNSSNVALLVDKERVLLFTDFRYAEAARTIEGTEFVQTQRSVLKTVVETLEGTIGFEATALTYSGWEMLRNG